jgi:hypothetical protein
MVLCKCENQMGVCMYLTGVRAPVKRFRSQERALYPESRFGRLSFLIDNGVLHSHNMPFSLGFIRDIILWANDWSITRWM